MDQISAKMIISIVIGGGLGYAYYRFVGCKTGACVIAGNPYIATIYGAVMGYIWAMK
ncbi:MAG: DUF6132 family protein [Ignavibacteria bacterium]|nr:DUF6132 family protein [Ignavibacteria bacterium]